jgi:Dolichyl-phosphate-mannose-protein mannosyltransferase
MITKGLYTPSGDMRKNFIALGLLTFAWLLIVFLVNPVGDFPLNDDWAYAKTVQSLLRGNLQLTDWAPASQIAQIAWGALFCLPFGFSFTALRISTLVLGWFGVLMTFAIAREMGAGRTVALLAALIILGNPDYLNSSFTFMTDVPFYAFCAPAIFFFVRALRKGENSDAMLGTLFATVATLTRQFGVVLPLAFALGSLVKNGINRKSLVRAVWPLVTVGGSLAIFQTWLSMTGRLPQMYKDQARELTKLFSVEGLSKILPVLAPMTLYVGLFLLPWLVLAAARSWRKRSTPALVQGLLFAIAMYGIVSVRKPLADGLIPNIFAGILYDLGTGFPILKDTFTLWLPHMPKAPIAFWVMVTTLGALGAALLAYFLTLALRTRKAEKGTIVFAISACLIYFLLLAPRSASYDRYFLFLLPLVMILALVPPETSKGPKILWAMSIAFALTLAYSAFSVASTHDYLAWNRVRWDALHKGLAEGRFTTKNMDGGFEFGGWYSYDSKYKAQPGKSWWWVDRDDFAIAFGPIDGYQIYERHPFDRWMPVGVQEVLILKRNNP